MSGDAIREAMARALCLSFYGTPWEGTSEFRRSICDNMANAALAALPVTAAQLAEIAAGRAVVVPVEATLAMELAAVDRLNTPEYLDGRESMYAGIYRAMIAAAPREGEP